jgi:hypothetical protein
VRSSGIGRIASLAEVALCRISVPTSGFAPAACGRDVLVKYLSGEV